MAGMRWRGKPGQLGEFGPALAHHPVPPADRRDDAIVVAQQRRQLVAAVGDGALAEAVTDELVRWRGVDVVADVELAPADLRQHVVAHAVAQEHLGALRGHRKAAHERTEPGKFGIEDGADAQRAALCFVQRVRRRLEIGCRRHRPVRQRQQRRAGLGQRESGRRAVEQLQPGALLERFQLQADRRLGQFQHRCRARYGALTGNRDEATQGLGTRKLDHVPCL